jgi:hypothetical protein
MEHLELPLRSVLVRLPETAAEWGALGEVTAALAAFIGLVAVALVLRQLRDSRNRFRAELAPYLRVDFTFRAAIGTWTPPATANSTLTFADLNPGVDEPRLRLHDWPGETSIELWVANQQADSAGIADRVLVRLEIESLDKEDENAVWVDEIQVQFSYLEPAHVNCYVVARVDPRFRS